MSLKLKDKKGNILNVANKSTYYSLLSTGNYTKYEKPVKEEEKEDKNTKNKAEKWGVINGKSFRKNQKRFIS